MVLVSQIDDVQWHIIFFKLLPVFARELIRTDAQSLEGKLSDLIVELKLYFRILDHIINMKYKTNA